MIKGACHCGAVSFEADPNGRFLVECNCSICRKLGVIWLLGPPALIKMNAPEGSTMTYRWGDKQLEFHSCASCGCTTHWSLVVNPSKMAVNMRLAAPDDVQSLPLRHFDGADSWAFLD